MIFASSRELLRFDRRQVDLSKALNRCGFGTLLFDLVEPGESAGDEGDIGQLAGRLIGATGWCRRQLGVNGLPLAFIGSDLGSAAALSAAAALIPRIRAIASRGGRPDLAGAAVGEVRTPTLLLIDAEDPTELEAARAAAALLPAPHRVHRVQQGPSQIGGWAATTAICQWMEWHMVEHAAASRGQLSIPPIR